MQTVEVRTPGRIHVGMLSFGHADVRAYGGVGMMLDRAGVHLRARPADRFEASGPLADRVVSFARLCAERLGGDARPCAIEVVSAPRSHVGLGSGTQLGLAVAAAVQAFTGHGDVARGTAACGTPDRADGNVLERAFSEREAIALARLSGRGRRSCVGVYGFGGGGLIIEAGRVVAAPAAPEDDTTRPFSPLVARIHPPEAWRCVLLIRRDAVGLNGEAERAAFRTLAAVPRDLTAELARIALIELAPAAVEGRFSEFADAVRRYGRLAGSPFEQASRTLPHAQATTALLDTLADLGAPGSAQSSWGPAVMACCESAEAAGALVDRLTTVGIAADHDVDISGFDRRGATLRRLS